MTDSSKALQWYVRERRFDKEALGKCEVVMSLGNGYLGLRSATEESYPGEIRDLFIAGTFDKFDEYEVTELPNAADTIRMEIKLDGEAFRLDTGKIEAYSRELYLKNGELYRYVRWQSPKGKRYELHFYRMVSLKRLHVIAQKIKILSLDGDASVELITGIDGRMTNQGTQHFSEKEKRFYEQRYMQLLQETVESKIVFFHNAVVKTSGRYQELLPEMMMERRELKCRYEMRAEKGIELEFEKISNIYTDRDKEKLHCSF